MRYSERFKEKIVRRMGGPDALSAGALCKEVGIAQSTLSRWLREANIASPFQFHIKNEVTTAMTSRRPQDWSAEEKLKVVLEAASVPEDQLGAFLRSKGIHETHLRQWRSQMLQGLHDKTSGKKEGLKPKEAKEIKELKKELARKEKALAEAAALLILKKKARAIWGDEDDDTVKKNGES